MHLSLLKRKLQLSERFQSERAVKALCAGAKLYEVLGLCEEALAKLRQEAVSLATAGHLDRALQNARALQALGDDSALTAALLGLCLEGLGELEEAAVIKVAILKNVEDGPSRQVLESIIGED